MSQYPEYKKGMLEGGEGYNPHEATANKDMKKLTIYITQEAYQKLREKGYLDKKKTTEVIR